MAEIVEFLEGSLSFSCSLAPSTTPSHGSCAGGAVGGKAKRGPRPCVSEAPLGADDALQPAAQDAVHGPTDWRSTHGLHAMVR